MHNAKRMVLAVMVICAGFAGVCSADKKHPSAMELLDKYAQTQNKLQNYSLKWDEAIDFKASLSGQWKSMSGARKKHLSHQIRTDGNRFYNERDMSGQVFAGSRVIAKDDPTHAMWVWDGVYHWSYSIGPKSHRKPGKPGFYGEIWVRKGMTEKSIKETINYAGGDKYLKGFALVGIGRIDKVLKDSEKLSVRKEMVKVNGAKCYVIYGVTKHGRIILYIDSEHGYNIAKAEIAKRQGDIRLGTIDRTMPEGDNSRTILENVRFEKISNTWFPMEADTVAIVNHANGDFVKTKTHHKRTELILNPDHEAMGSFVPDIPNGPNVRIVGLDSKSGKYTWRDGAVVDANGNKVDLEKISKETKNLGN
jgi:hypothetical protein